MAQVFEATKGFAEHLGKTVSLSLDRPGFIVNRILMPMINEAFFVLMEARAVSLHCVCQGLQASHISSSWRPWTSKAAFTLT